MAIGRVKWFSNEKGYGFIEAVESKQDVFVHFSDIVMEGYKTLKENAMVFFVLEQGAKGPGARHVCPLNEAADGQQPPTQQDITVPEPVAEADYAFDGAAVFSGHEDRLKKRPKVRNHRQSAMA